MLRTAIKSVVFAVTFAVMAISSSAMASTQAPFGDLVDVEGNAITDEADLGNTGKWELVMIWAIDCPICKVMKPIMSDFHDAHKDTNAVVYGVALDGHENHEAVKQYMIDNKISFPTYVGNFDIVSTNVESGTQVPIRGTPTYLLYNPAGELTATEFGYMDVDSVSNFIASHNNPAAADE